MSEPVLLVGGGGHCRSVIDVIESTEEWSVAGIVDPRGKNEETVWGYPLVGNDDDLPILLQQYPNAVITVGQIKENTVRRSLHSLLESLGGRLPVIASPHARISAHAFISEGSVICHRAVVNAGVKIGRCAIINTGAVVEHDTVIGDFCHVSTGALLNGNVAIGDNVFVGSGAIINNHIAVSPDTIIGSGAIVIGNIVKSGIYTGVVK